ncbi:MAG: metal ABC transporter ATP-binding protein [Ruminococcaceae bacterium]|nr:metal ABC transporter ATP-binding protein [Oscillospiraceae bacterium]
MALVSCNNISLSYENKIVMTNLSFHINKGDYCCIAGENGSGKSTLVKAILSLKTINSGSILFGDGLRRREIGYLPQQTVVQKDFPASVWEIVLSGCLNRKKINPFYTKEDKKRAADNMEKLGITHLKRECYRDLSGGQQQRVLLARALCATEKLLLLDEPMAGLDPIVTQELYELIEDLNKSGITVIMVTHDLPSAVKYATHILHLQNGEFYFGNTKDYIHSEVGRKFLGEIKCDHCGGEI